MILRCLGRKSKRMFVGQIDNFEYGRFEGESTISFLFKFFLEHLSKSVL